MASTSQDLPRSMRVWERRGRGPIETHLRPTPYPTPELPPPDSDEVLIRISSVAIAFSMAVLLPVIPALPFAPPLIPEFEFAGTVIAAGAQAPRDVREIGTRVAGFQNVPAVMLKGQGVLREYLRISGSSVARMPDSMAGETGLDQAAGLSASGSTALAMLRAAAVKAGDRVLVNGASGAIGNMVVQMAHRKGAHVVGVASARNEEFVRSVGADEFVDYTAHADLAAHLASSFGSLPFDAILDCVGIQSLYEASPAYLKKDGKVINVGAMNGMVAGFWNWFQNAWRPVWLGGTPRKYVMFSTIPTRDDSILLLKMVEDGELRMYVDSVWEAGEVPKAYERAASKRARGKVVIKVQQGE